MTTLTEKERILLQQLSADLWFENKDKIIAQIVNLTAEHKDIVTRNPDLTLVMGFAFAYGYAEGCRHIMEQGGDVKLDSVARNRVVQ